jgi:dienelactone hydrolase
MPALLHPNPPLLPEPSPPGWCRPFRGWLLAAPLAWALAAPGCAQAPAPARTAAAPGPLTVAPARADAGALPLPSAAAASPRTLVLQLAGRPVTLDVYRPAGVPRGAVVLSHGFTRSRSTLGGHAAALAGSGLLALTPDLPYTFDFRRNAQALAELVALLRGGPGLGPSPPAANAAHAAVLGPPVERVVLVGFSAGGLSSLLAAGTPGVVGYVGLDPFDRVERGAAGGAAPLGLAHARTLQTPALLLRAPPSRCNAESVAAPWGAALPKLQADTVIEGATHCDFESPTDWMCRWACGGADPGRQAQVRAALLAAVEGWMR